MVTHGDPNQSELMPSISALCGRHEPAGPRRMYVRFPQAGLQAGDGEEHVGQGPASTSPPPTLKAAFSAHETTRCLPGALLLSPPLGAPVSCTAGNGKGGPRTSKAHSRRRHKDSERGASPANAAKQETAEEGAVSHTGERAGRGGRGADRRRASGRGTGGQRAGGQTRRRGIL